MRLLPVVHERDGAFAYTCNGCGACCHHKRITVSPYEAARLAEVLGVSTTEAMAEHIDPETSALRSVTDGACTFLVGGACTVHSGRPLACRLYPLAWFDTDDDEVFSELAAHPQSTGTYGGDGTIASYLEAQGTAPYEHAARRYAAMLNRLIAVADMDGPDPGDPPPLTDIDAAVRADCDARGVPVPDDVEARVDLHLALLHRWLDAASPPASGGA